MYNSLFCNQEQISNACITTVEDLELSLNFEKACWQIVNKGKYYTKYNPFAFWCIPRIIILGEDPYSNEADGLAFSQKEPKGSLRNMLIACGCPLAAYPGSLQPWRHQGVMLLNCYLTYPGKPKAWEPFVSKVILSFPSAIIFAWGNIAQKKIAKLNPPNKVLTYCHPSPQNGVKFHSCPHFNQTKALVQWDFETKKRVSCRVVIKRRIHCQGFITGVYSDYKVLQNLWTCYQIDYKVYISRDAFRWLFKQQGF